MREVLCKVFRFYLSFFNKPGSFRDKEYYLSLALEMVFLLTSDRARLAVAVEKDQGLILNAIQVSQTYVGF